MATRSRKHQIDSMPRDTPPKAPAEQEREQGETSHGWSLTQAVARSSPWRAIASIAVATASAISSPSCCLTGPCVSCLNLFHIVTLSSRHLRVEIV